MPIIGINVVGFNNEGNSMKETNIEGIEYAINKAIDIDKAKEVAYHSYRQIQYKLSLQNTLPVEIRPFFLHAVFTEVAGEFAITAAFLVGEVFSAHTSVFARF